MDNHLPGGAEGEYEIMIGCRVPLGMHGGVALLAALLLTVSAGCSGGPVPSATASPSPPVTPSPSLGFRTETQGVFIDDTGLSMTRDGGHTWQEVRF